MESSSSNPQPHSLLTLVIAIVLLVFVSYKAYTIAICPLAHVPGPFISRCTNLRLKYAILRGNRVCYIHSLHQRYGPVVRVAPNEVALNDASAAKTIYKMGSPFMKTRFYSIFTGQRTTNLFSTCDAHWHGQHRRLTSANFSEQSVRLMEPYVAKNVQLAAQRIHDEATRDGFVDVLKWFMFMATDVIGEASFGESFRMLETGKKDQYIADLEDLAAMGIVRVELESIINLMAKLPFGPAKKFPRIAARMNKYSDESIQRYWRRYSADPENVKPTLLTKEYALAENGVLPAEQLVHDARGYIIAGTDTTAITATYAVWELARHLEVQAALCGEVAGLPVDFNNDDLKTLPVLNQVLQETLRLHSAVGQGLPRAVPEGGADFGAYHLVGGTVVGVQAYSMHRDPAIWREPERFDPSRWENPSKAMLENFYPFGGGGRVCVGMHFAKLELRHALANFYRTFEVGVKPAYVQGFSDWEMEPLSWFLEPPRGNRCLVASRK
ncbi:hypothetical protein LTR62_001580 [Meristemomyces frigidus]|uniref:Cytochrome P450 n=1 Tax=Meristemomyces frigidus TaxID=1508187 RepID=A0AAN7T8Z7_9PEZI|nr:hypothetical protein LTR62_001580 [Meristemomyces frigidus]